MKTKKRFLTLFLAFVMILSSAFVAFGSETSISEEQAMNKLTLKVYSAVASKTYKLDGGGTIEGSNLFYQDDSDSNYYFNDNNLEKLSSSGKNAFFTDIVDASWDEVEKEVDREQGNAPSGEVEKTGITEDTVSNWWKELQKSPGAGTAFMNQVLSGTKPDFVSARKIYQPFSGKIGTLLGILSILVMSLLAVTMLLDIFYIVIPPFRLIVGADGKGGDGSDKGGLKKLGSSIISHNARVAVEQEENDGDGKQAIWIYFKRQVLQLAALGICLLYLINGQIYKLVSMILDLMSGFLGF